MSPSGLSENLWSGQEISRARMGQRNGDGTEKRGRSGDRQLSWKPIGVRMNILTGETDRDIRRYPYTDDADNNETAEKWIPIFFSCPRRARWPRPGCRSEGVGPAGAGFRLDAGLTGRQCFKALVTKRSAPFVLVGDRPDLSAVTKHEGMESHESRELDANLT